MGTENEALAGQKPQIAGRGKRPTVNLQLLAIGIAMFMSACGRAVPAELEPGPQPTPPHLSYPTHQAIATRTLPPDSNGNSLPESTESAQFEETPLASLQLALTPAQIPSPTSAGTSEQVLQVGEETRQSPKTAEIGCPITTTGSITKSLGLIAFTATEWPLHQPQTLPVTLYTAKPDGTELVQLVDFAYVLEFAWSPNGLQIAFAGVSNFDGGECGLYVINWDGSGLEKVSNHAVAEAAVSWSPDGEKIAFECETSVICVIERSGQNMIELTRGMSPSWMSDGRYITFTRNKRGLYINTNIYGIEPDGTDLRQFTDDWFYNGSPLWSPDSRHAIYGRLVGNESVLIMVDGNWSNQEWIEIRDSSGNDYEGSAALTWLPQSNGFLLADVLAGSILVVDVENFTAVPLSSNFPRMSFFLAAAQPVFRPQSCASPE